MLLIAAAAGLAITLITITSSYYLTYFAYRLGFDPDNVVVPLITSLMDLTGTGMIVLLMFLLI
jgi:mgtE-like transporter